MKGKNIPYNDEIEKVPRRRFDASKNRSHYED